MKKLVLVLVFVLVGFSVFAQNHTDFSYKISKDNYNEEIFLLGEKGKQNTPQDKLDILKQLVNNGTLVIEPNLNKATWDLSRYEKGIITKDIMELVVVSLTLYCGNYNGNYFYWSKLYMQNRKMIGECNFATQELNIYNVW